MFKFMSYKCTVSFNTQPPEGGWIYGSRLSVGRGCFNTQPPEGGWVSDPVYGEQGRYVSTHSRPKAAGVFGYFCTHFLQRFNTQPPEGGWLNEPPNVHKTECFNTQPPEGGWCRCTHRRSVRDSFNTQPPEGGWVQKKKR